MWNGNTSARQENELLQVLMGLIGVASKKHGASKKTRSFKQNSGAVFVCKLSLFFYAFTVLFKLSLFFLKVFSVFLELFTVFEAFTFLFKLSLFLFDLSLCLFLHLY